MTSNRYIAEVLDTARETLLAFVDRIAFISFIPRGFADSTGLRTVVRRHGGGFGRHKPQAYLSVQDLDVLQAAADLTYVPEQTCDAVAQLVGLLDAELAEAQRYDPKFQPTRYLSTRSAVTATKVLRAAVVFSKIFHEPDRALHVRHEDLSALQHFLLLGGMPRAAIAARIAQETDPRERRQLDIMATEGEAFSRCLARLPRPATTPPPPSLDLGRLESMAAHARNSANPDALAKAVGSLLEATESGATESKLAAELLVETVGTLSGQALRGGLTPELGGVDPLEYLRAQLVGFATSLERAPGCGRPLATWLRGRVLALLDDALARPPQRNRRAGARRDARGAAGRTRRSAAVTRGGVAARAGPDRP